MHKRNIKKWLMVCVTALGVVLLGDYKQLMTNNNRTKTKNEDSQEELNQVSMDIEVLEQSEHKYLGEFKLEEKDRVLYDIVADGDGILNIGFTKEYLHEEIEFSIEHAEEHTNMIGSSIVGINEMKDIESGVYHLWISSDEGNLVDITGNISIEKS